MIKVIKGTVGVVLNGRRTTKTYEDAPFVLPKKEEERLVRLGVAAYYSTGMIGPSAGLSNDPVNQDDDDDPENENPVAPDVDPDDDDDDIVDPEDDDEADSLEEMTFKELQGMAKSMGLNAQGNRDELVLKIKTARSVSMSVAKPED